MNSRMTIRESQSTALNDTGEPVDEINTMIELMAEENEHLLSTSVTARGMSLTAEGCVGQIMLRDGTCYDIVPAMAAAGTGTEEASRMLMTMLYSVFGMDPNKSSCSDLFEFFVKVYIDEVNRLVAKGLRSKYDLVQGNEKTFKGKILFSENIRENFIHKERVYCEYEVFSQNRPENRLIKKTLEILSRITLDGRNLKNAKTLLLFFEEIPSSMDVSRDLDMCIIDRNMLDYISPLLWCNIFLKGLGLGGGSSGGVSYSLLVKADALFAAYVARVSSRGRKNGSYSIRYKARVLSDGRKNGSSVVIIDLKWNFYDRAKNLMIDDAESMFMSAPGYRVIPPAEKGGRLRAMANSYLSDAQV